ncbi:MAG: hypothetical protein JST69_14440 [Bacteroidetes bacterium]|nr:hypothetical protein [Bacteroidota bacterium]
MRQDQRTSYVKIYLELYELDGQLKPTRFCLGERTYADNFPLRFSNQIKLGYIKNFVRGRFEFHGALYFKVQVREKEDGEIIFSCEDFLEDDPAKRYCQIWKWDKINKMGIGFTYSPDQFN